ARLLRVGGTCAARRPGTILRHVALAGSPPTHEAAGLHHVGRAAGARPRAHLVGITGVARARAARPAGLPGGMLAGDARAVGLVHVAGVPAGGAPRAARLLRVGGACAARRPRTVLRHVALAASRPTHEAAGLHHVGRTAGARPRAHLVGITGVARARAA